MTHMDHGLLGSGLVADMRSCREHLLEEKAEIFPARANIYVMAIQWISELDGQELKGLDDFRWSPYPRRVDLNMGGWRGLSKPQKVADLNLADFESCELELALALENSGTLHGFVFWFELAGNGLNLNTGPDGTNWPGQAFQYCDPADVNEKDQLAVTLHVTEDRLFFQTTPPISQIRKGSLPRWAFGHGSSSNWFTTYRKSMVRALKQYQPKTLLNIGAGDGLLALAAAAGDTHIYAVERSTNLCEGLRQNLKALGLSDRVTVLNHDPRELKHPEHLPQKADMVLFDNFDCGLLGDGALHYLQHALEHLTVEKPVLLPRSAVIKAKLIERRLDTLADQDVSLLTPYLFAPDYQEVYLNQTPHRSLSDDFEVFRFDFAAAKVEEQEKDFQVTISQQGIVGAVVFWFELQLDDETTLSTHPSTCEGERGQGLQFLAEVNVEPGTELGMKVKHTGSNLIFALKPDGISEEQIVQLPRFDPRWMSMHQNLMQQTGQMMQQLQTSPEEFAKVVDLAARLAAHPACYGVDPATADRYLNSFMVI